MMEQGTKITMIAKEWKIRTRRNVNVKRERDNRECLRETHVAFITSAVMQFSGVQFIIAIHMQLLLKYMRSSTRTHLCRRRVEKETILSISVTDKIMSVGL